MSAFVQTSHPLLGCSSRRCRNAPRCPVCILCHVCSPRPASLQVAFNECFDSDVLKCRGKEREMREKRRKVGQGEETENGRMEGEGRERRKERKRGKSGQGSAPRLRGSRCVSWVTPRCPADRLFPTLPQLLRLACTRPRNQPDGSNKGLLVTSPRMTPTWAWARRPKLPVTLGACEDATLPKEV